MPRRVAALAFTASSLLACGEPAPPDARLVAQWIRASIELVQSEQLGPPMASRMAAYGSLALYEGYAADGASGLRSLAGQLNGLWSVPIAPSGRPVDGATVAAEAERLVLDSLYSEGSAATKRAIDSLGQAQILHRRRSGVSPATIERSVEHGRALGRVILAWAATDGFLATRGRSWIPPRSPALWGSTMTAARAARDARSPPREHGVVLAGSAAADLVRGAHGPGTTLPRFDPTRPVEPHWGTLRAFALRNGDECAPPRPPSYSEARGSEFWKMGKELLDSASSLTTEKREIAMFWSGHSVAATPAVRWMGIVSQMVARRDLTADRAVEAHALTAVAIADAVIGSWKEKYRSLVVRPATFVQRVFDPKWEAALAPPPFPEYPADSPVLSGAATEILIRLLGDTIPFADTVRVDAESRVRAFRNFTHARDEVGVAGVFGGIDFVPSAVNGLAQGQCIGQRVGGRLKTR